MNSFRNLGTNGILVYVGFKRSKALLLNSAVALNVVLGGIMAIMFVENLEALSGMLIALSPDGFIYLAASELVPELHKEKDFKKSAVQFVIFMLGIVLMWSLGAIFPG